jgi:hypothetical protein
MMREILGVADESEARRRWFHDEYFDLFVWQSVSGEIILFQLCYGIDSSERALVWHKDAGFFHDGAEAGAAGAGDVIGAERVPDNDPVISRFVAAAHPVPDDIRSAVTAHIREYAETRPVPTRRRRFRRADWQQKPPAAPAQMSGQKETGRG